MSDREKLQALLDGEELKSFALRTASGIRYLYMRLDEKGGLVQKVAETMGDGTVSEKIVSSELFGFLAVDKPEITEDSLESIEAIVRATENLYDSVKSLLGRFRELRDDLERSDNED